MMMMTSPIFKSRRACVNVAHVSHASLASAHSITHTHFVQILVLRVHRKTAHCDAGFALRSGYKLQQQRACVTKCVYSRACVRSSAQMAVESSAPRCTLMANDARRHDTTHDNQTYARTQCRRGRRRPHRNGGGIELRPLRSLTPSRFCVCIRAVCTCCHGGGGGSSGTAKRLPIGTRSARVLLRIVGDAMRAREHRTYVRTHRTHTYIHTHTSRPRPSGGCSVRFGRRRFCCAHRHN